MRRSVVIFGSIPKSNFWRLLTSWHSHFAYFNAIYVDKYVVMCLININLCNFHVCKWENACIKYLNALRIFMNISLIYLGEGKRGYTNACICIRIHSQPLLQNHLMDFDETWYGWSAQGPLHVARHFGQICSAADPGRANIGHDGPLLQEISSSDWKATATNRMQINDLEACEKKCCYFWFHSEVKF